MNRLNSAEKHSLFQVKDLLQVPKIYSNSIDVRISFMIYVFLTDHPLWQYREYLLLHREIFDNVPEMTHVFNHGRTLSYFNDVTSIDKFRVIPKPRILIEKISHFNHHSTMEKEIFTLNSQTNSSLTSNLSLQHHPMMKSA